MFGQIVPNIWAMVAQCSSTRKQNATYIRTQLTVLSYFDSSSQVAAVACQGDAPASSRGREAPATVPSMLDLVTKTDEAMDAAIALAAGTEVAVGKVKEVLVKMATVNVEDSCVAAWAATTTSRDAKVFVNAYQESRESKALAGLCYTTATVASRGLAAMASRGVTAQTNPSLSTMGSRQAARDALELAIRSSQQTFMEAQRMVEKTKEALQLAEEALAAAEQSQAAAEATWTWP